MKVRFFFMDGAGEVIDSFLYDVDDRMCWQDLDEIGFSAMKENPEIESFDYEAED